MIDKLAVLLALLFGLWGVVFTVKRNGAYPGVWYESVVFHGLVFSGVALIVYAMFWVELRLIEILQ